MPSPTSRPEPAVELVLSAEQVRTSTRRVPRERVRVRREVVTEEVTVTVTVRREVLRVEHHPLDPQQLDDDGGPVRADPSGTAVPWEVVLSEERPVVSLEVVPYERVRVGVREVSTTTAVVTDRAREVLDEPVVQTAAGDAGAG